jgi:hypothetical protein
LNTRERFQRVLRFQSVDRLPCVETIWWWDQTLARWRTEGLPADLKEPADIARYFDLDGYFVHWISPRWSLRRPEGRTRPEGYLTRDADYEKEIRPAYRQDLEEARWKELAAQQQRGDIFLALQLDGPFWFSREVFGVERHLYSFYDEAELLQRMGADLCECNLHIFRQACEIAPPDMVILAEDMSYNHGPMLSQQSFETFIAPAYRRFCEEAHRHGALVFVDSDGLLTLLLPWLQAAVIDGILPIERQAKNDPCQMRRQHPKLRMIGGFDKTIMHLGREAMREEFERLLPAMKSGGYIPGVDHQTPPDVSLATYREYLALQREYCRRCGS